MKRSNAGFIAGANARNDGGCADARRADEREEQVEDGSCTRSAANVDRLGVHVRAVIRASAQTI